MKKIILALTVMAFMMTVVAQDTVRYGDSCYMFNALHAPLRPWQVSPGVYQAYDTSNYINGMPPLLYIASNMVRVYGVAVTVFLREGDTDSSLYKAYLCRYRHAQLEVIDSSTAYSVKNCFRYNAVGDDGEQYEGYSPSLEYYFSRPHDMNADVDSFLVGLQRRVIVQSGCPDSVFYKEVRALPRDVADRGLEYKSWSNSLGIQTWWGRIFPIIQPERISCETSVAEVVETGEDYAVLSWGMDGDSCQLSIAPYDVPVDSGMVIDLTTDSYTATSLDSGVYYAARLRTQCRHRCHIHDDTLVWGGWGAPTLFYLGSEEPDTTGIGIQRVEQAPEMEISPNPTTGTLTVRCGAEIEGVELYDMQGRVVSGQWSVVNGQCVVLDLAALPAGSYTVVVRTAKGVTAKQVVVQ